jgi:hypothetical protein
MKIEIIKSPSGKMCAHERCKKDPTFVTPKGRIKKGKSCAKITHRIMSSKNLKFMNFFYCRNCIDQLLIECRANLDAKLWIFK